MATGTGKTIVMTMLVAWQMLNKVTYRRNPVLEERVRRGPGADGAKPAFRCLIPDSPGNYYDEFNIVPPGMIENVCVRGGCWCAIGTPWVGRPRSRLPRRRSVDKRGAKSDEAYVREVLGEMAAARDILVINDEAHHAWRVPAESKVKA